MRAFHSNLDMVGNDIYDESNILDMLGIFGSNILDHIYCLLASFKDLFDRAEQKVSRLH